MLVLGVRAVADRPETVERGRVEAGEVAVRGASHTRLVEGEAELRSDPLGGEPEGAIAGRPGHRRPPERPRHAERRRCLNRASPRIAASTRRASSSVRTRTSTAALAVGATTFRAEPAVDGADVDRGPAVRIVEREEALDLVGELENRAHALAGAHSGVGRLSGDLQREGAGRLPLGLQLPARTKGGLEDERAGGGTGEAEEVALGVRAAEFLITHDERHGRHRRGEVELRERSEGKEHLDEAALHVEDSRSVEPPVNGAHGHLLERPERPHRVEMADEELEGMCAQAIARVREQVVTGALAGNPPDREAERGERLAEQLRTPPAARPERARAIRLGRAARATRTWPTPAP